MNTILVPTDFSIPADNAAQYALQLAMRMKTGIKLCHALKIPVEAPMAAQVAWPLEDYVSLKNEANDQLSLLAEKLEKDIEEQISSLPASYQPKVHYTSEVGAADDVIRNVFDEQKMTLVVMGMSGAGPLSRFFLGSTSRDLIDKATFPVLLIPAGFKFKTIKKIAFASDLSEGDVKVIHSLAGMARFFNAEILITHVISEKFEQITEQNRVEVFLNEVTGTADYDKIYYRAVKSLDVIHGLDWLVEHGQVDILAMVHRRHHFLNYIFRGSYAQKMAQHITMPLMVFPPDFEEVI